MGLVTVSLALTQPEAGAFSSEFSIQQRFSPLATGYIERAEIMLAEKNFAGVIDQIEYINTQDLTLNAEEKERCLYMLALALYNRGDAECVDLLREFAERYPASPLAMATRLASADYFFFAGSFNNALAAYMEIDYDRINPGELPLYEYRKALSMVRSGLLNEAKPIFTSLLANPSYETAAEYYLAYIDYAQGKYRDARNGFEKVMEKTGPANSDGLQPAYYLAQIDYAEGNYSKVIEEGENLLSLPAASEVIPETRRILGLSYFKTGDYRNARPLLLEYTDTPGFSHAPDADYALGVMDYEDGDYDSAIERFSLLTDLDNDLAQSAYLYLGQIAVAQGDNNAAAISFGKASAMDYDRDVTEAATFNYIVARTKGGNVPFSSSIPLLTSFMERFPSSRYESEVEEYLAYAYFNERDYANALRSINRVSSPSAEVLAAKQKILYELGVEAMADNRPAEAVGYLTEAVAISGNSQTGIQSELWLADALYATGEYRDAEKSYTRFLSASGEGTNRLKALYGRGYARLMNGDYKGAVPDFRQVADADYGVPASLRDDALIRYADVLYYSGDYRNALKIYRQAIEAGVPDSDYATYRAAVMAGLSGDMTTKLKELDAMPTRFPNSIWLADALLEKGETYAALGDLRNAAAAFEQLKLLHDRTPQARRGMLDLALTYMKAGENAAGERIYREIIVKWPTSEEASLANDDLRAIHAANGTLQSYASFLESIPGGPRLEKDEMEKLAFEAAETSLAESNSPSRLEKYVSDYPNGTYLSEALLDLALFREENGDRKGAIEAAGMILEKRKDSPQWQEAVLVKARLLEKGSVAERSESTSYYKLLEQSGSPEFLPEALTGIMRTTDNPEERLRYASMVKNTGGVPAETMEEAELYEALAQLDGNYPSEGERNLERLAANPKSKAGAQAAVTLAQHFLDQGQYDRAEEILTEFTSKGTPHQYWLARGFIALADVNHAKGKDYLAVEYLKSLRSNYPGREIDIQDMINSRLSKWN